jgi:hypothetical protein
MLNPTASASFNKATGCPLRFSYGTGLPLNPQSSSTHNTWALNSASWMCVSLKCPKFDLLGSYDITVFNSE